MQNTEQDAKNEQRQEKRQHPKAPLRPYDIVTALTANVYMLIRGKYSTRPPHPIAVISLSTMLVAKCHCAPPILFFRTKGNHQLITVVLHLTLLLGIYVVRS